MEAAITLPSAGGLDDPGGYDGVAAAYARLSHRWSRPLATALVVRAQISPGDRVLDVGTGSGIVAAEAASRLGGGGHVLGVDVSAAMLAEARGAVAALPNLDLRGMAAEALDLPDASFDVALSLFAVAHFKDPAAAVREMHRVLRPGGRLALGMGSRAPVLSVAGLTHRVGRVLALVEPRGRSLVAPGFLEGLLESEGGPPLHEAPHVAIRSLVELVHTAGFEDILTSWVGHDAEIATAEEFWDVQATFSTPARAWLAAADPEARRALRERFLTECARVQARGGRLLYPQGALLVSARRPAAAV